MSMYLESLTLTHYPELDGELTPQQWDTIARGYATPVEQDELVPWEAQNAEWMAERIVTKPFGERAVRVFVDRPEESDDAKVMFALGEFGNGLTEPAIHRARIVRDATAPESTLILVPNDAYGEKDNLGFTPLEREQLRDHEATPFVRRLQMLSEGFEDVSVFGPSQGATIAMAFGAHRDSPSIALGAVEPPNVVRRPNRLTLGRAFAGSAGHLVENIEVNTPRNASSIIDRHIESITLLGNVRYGRGVILPSNLAIASLMKNNNFRYDTARSLERGGSVAHVWAANSLVSPDGHNTAIAELFADNDHYSALRLQGEIADHSSTNVAAVGIAAMNRAIAARNR